jgi:hypothetical protein
LALAALVSLAAAPAIAQTTATQLNGGAASIILPPKAGKMDHDTLGAMAPTIMGFALFRAVVEQPSTAMVSMTAIGASVMSGEGWMTHGETKDGIFFVVDFAIPSDFAAAELPLRCPAKLPVSAGAASQAHCQLIDDRDLQGVEITRSQDGQPKSVFRLFARSGRLYEVGLVSATTLGSPADAVARHSLESLRVK